MTNLFALSLIVTSLTAAGLWCPSPAADHHRQEHDQDIIVKEGHRVVVVEYDDQGRHNTKVSISPESAPTHSPGDGRHRNRDIICDAFGKCKHKIASAMEKAKSLVSESVHEACDKAKETGLDVETWVSEKADGVKESADIVGEDAIERVNESFEKTKEKVAEKTHDLKQSAKEYGEKAKETLKEVKDKGKSVGEGVMESIEKEAEKIKAGGDELKEKGQRKLILILDRGLKLVNEAVRYLSPAESLKAATDLLGLLGFSMALGMGVWTTFISSYVLANAMPRQQLAVVQSKIYGVYFRAMACSVGIALLGFVFDHTKGMFSSTGAIFQGSMLSVALLMILANSLYMEPRATRVMFERLRMEKEEGKGIEDLTRESRQVTDTPAATTTSQATTTAEFIDRELVKSRIVGLNQRLKKLNTYSSLLNLLTLMALTCHLVYLSQRLRISR